MSKSESIVKWRDFYRNLIQKGSPLRWPSESLVQLMLGRYISNLNKNYENQRVIDVGFGSGNNLLFLQSIGCSVAGVELHEDICTETADSLRELGCMEADLRSGTNTDIPFGDCTFDVLVSWNVIHYEDNRDSILKAINEYARVIKSGGRFFLSTTGPKHMIIEGSESIGNNRYRIGRSDDFRKGEIFFYFENPETIKECFSEAFSQIEVGRSTKNLFNETLDFFLVTGICR